ncbi:lysylphosphatidylglycerol synthase transmembrane domain-containing protein [Marinobacter sp. P4B1]|uniref:lysylphosphatidylglycerol synthase transmembrane domain-containing protein n=1 Tax=Marinobacter sp. P4B1 TaxID=1119533 RepID=UPI0009EC3BBE|nr:lysylphosphatidylglycerol synthase transmembrane domain-containing protein [Marinobacter sp. P4B1]
MATRLILRWLVTVALLGLVLSLLDTGALRASLARLSVPFIALMLGVSVVQVALSAWRWWFTARRLRVSLKYPVAMREYYLAGFLNQVLPGGVMGDVNRAWRHARAPVGEPLSGNPTRAIIHAVMLERLSGQLVLLPVAVLATTALWLGGRFELQAAYAGTSLSAGAGMVALVLAGVGASLMFRRKNGSRLGSYLRNLGADLRKAFYGWRNACLQCLTSLLVLGTYLAVFLLLAADMDVLGQGVSPWMLAGLCVLLLLAMAVPVTISGWGVREGAAALLWPLAGLPAEQGVALSVGYGAMVFLASLPGALVLVSGR